MTAIIYAPDPSSQVACTIGGNIAENSGGPHTLKYGVTTNHVLGLELVLPDGAIAQLGGPVEELCGYDLVGAVVGTEGTVGIVTRATLKLSRIPEAHRTMLAVFAEVEDATRAVSAIIAHGIIPGAIEMMDRLIIRAVEDAFQVGLPVDAGAVLIIELDGIAAGMPAHAAQVSELVKAAGAREVRVARDEARAHDALESAQARVRRGRTARAELRDARWRRTAHAAARYSGRILAISARHNLAIGNVFHAGDGNIHPIVLYDERDPDQVRRAIDAGHEILEACLATGRQSHRRARNRRREDQRNAALVFTRRFDRDERVAARVRSRATLQSQQGDPAARRMRRES